MRPRIRAIVLLCVLLGLAFGGFGPATGQDAEPSYPFPVLSDEFKVGQVVVKLSERASTV